MTYRRVCLRMLLALAVVLGVGLGYQSFFGTGATVQAAAAAPPVPCPVCNDNNDDTFDSCVNGQCVFTPIDGIPATVVFTLNDSGRGSLRAAIEAANNSPADDVITFLVNGTITLTSGELIVEGNGKLTIQGNGLSQTIISGNNAMRVFSISPYNYFPGTDVTFNHLTIEKGNVRDNFHSCNFGGAIYNPFSTVTMNHCTISGNTATGGACNAGGAIYNGGTLKLTNCTFTNNGVSDSGQTDEGGAIFNGGMANLTNCTLTNNSTRGNRSQYGGAISNASVMTLTNCTLTGNSANSSERGSNYGGAISNRGIVNVINSTLSGNSVSGGTGSINFGGGIYNNAGLESATLNLTNSTVSGNSVSGDSLSQGGGLYNLALFGTLTVNLIHSTISGNTTSGGRLGESGGGSYNNASFGTLTVNAVNTIISGNTAATDPDLYGPLTTNTNNLIGGNAMLGALANNGGPTQTMKPEPDSPAIDAGNNCVLTDTCASSLPDGALTTDQRGTGFNRLVGNRVDIGAFEFVPPNTPPILSYASNPSTTYGTALTITPTDGPSDNVGVASVQLISTPVPGITINSSGVISVAATVPAGSYPLQVQATDNEGGPNGTTTASLTLTVNRALLTVTVNNAWRNLNEANPPLSGTIAGLRNGDAITASYSTSAHQSSPAGPYPITAVLRDPNNRLSNYHLTNTAGTLTILASCSAAISPTTLPNGTRGQAYNVPLSVVALLSSVAGSYSFTHVAGQLPPGVQLVNTSGAWSLRGTPTAGGAFTFTLLAQKVVGTCERARTYTLTIAP